MQKRSNHGRTAVYYKIKIEWPTSAHRVEPLKQLGPFSGFDRSTEDLWLRDDLRRPANHSLSDSHCFQMLVSCDRFQNTWTAADDGKPREAVSLSYSFRNLCPGIRDEVQEF